MTELWRESDECIWNFKHITFGSAGKRMRCHNFQNAHQIYWNRHSKSESRPRNLYWVFKVRATLCNAFWLIWGILAHIWREFGEIWLVLTDWLLDCGKILRNCTPASEFGRRWMCLGVSPLNHSQPKFARCALFPVSQKCSNFVHLTSNVTAPRYRAFARQSPSYRDNITRKGFSGWHFLTGPGVRGFPLMRPTGRDSDETLSPAGVN